MAQNNEEEGYKMKMYATQADTILQQEEKQRLGKLKPNVSVSQNIPDSGRNNSKTTLSSNIFFEDQVSNVIAVITERLITLQKNIRELSEREENNRISQEKVEKKIREELEMKIENEMICFKKYVRELLERETYRIFQERMEEKIRNTREEIEALKKKWSEQNVYYHRILQKRISYEDNLVDESEDACQNLLPRIIALEEQVTVAVTQITQAVNRVHNKVRQLELNDTRNIQIKLSQQSVEAMINKKLDNEKTINLEHASEKKTDENAIREYTQTIDEKIGEIEENNINADRTGPKGKQVGELEMKNRETINIMSSPHIQVIGGYYGQKGYCSNIFLLDYYEKIWKDVSIKLPDKVKSHGTVILEDELYIIGGYISRSVTNTLHRLNKQMKWEKLADMQEERAEITNSCISHNGYIWVIGGWNRYKINLNTIEKYNPSTNRWEEKPAMKRHRGSAAAIGIKNKIYVCGGYDGSSRLDSVEAFDIDSEVWTDFCTLPAPRSSMSIIVDRTSIILIGGYNNGSVGNNVWKMDVEDRNKGWINLPSLNEGRSESSAVRIETGYILLFGGANKKRQTSSTVEIFNGQKWETFTPLSKPRKNHTSVVATPAMMRAFSPYVL